MKKILCSLTLFFLLYDTKAQTYTFDRGSGSETDLGIAVTALHLIEQNKPEQLAAAFSSEFQPDKNNIRKACKYTSDNFPPGLHPPPFFRNSTDTATWYERTYVNVKGSDTLYRLQISLSLRKTQNKARIAYIQFREKDKITKRAVELSLLTSKSDANHPLPESLKAVPLPEVFAPSNIPDTIRTKKGDRYTPIPGTRLFIQVPAGFRPASNYVGIVKDSITGVVITDLPGVNFFENTKDMTSQIFEKSGARVFEYKEFVFNGYSAKFVRLMGDNQLEGMNFLFGDSTFSMMLAGIYLPADTTTEHQMKRAMLSSGFELHKKINPFETVSFRLDETKSAFKFQSYAGGAFKYTRGGKQQTVKDGSNETLLMVAALPLRKSATVQSACESMLLQAQQSGLLNFQIVSAGPVKINGFSGYEMIVSGTIRNEHSGVLLLVLKVKSDQVVQFQGLYKAEDKTSPIEMKKLSLSLLLLSH
jgi:hypothetical protein